MPKNKCLRDGCINLKGIKYDINTSDRNGDEGGKSSLREVFHRVPRSMAAFLDVRLGHGKMTFTDDR